MTKTQQVEKNPAAFSAIDRLRAIETLLGMSGRLVDVANAAEPFSADRARKQAAALAMHARVDALMAADKALDAATV